MSHCDRLSYCDNSAHIRHYRRRGEGIPADGFTWMIAAGWRQALDSFLDDDEPVQWRVDLCREKLAMAEWYEAADAAAERRSGYREADAAAEAACDQMVDARRQVMETPARSVVDLTRQAQTVQEMADWAEYGEELATSVLRFAGGAHG